MAISEVEKEFKESTTKFKNAIDEMRTASTAFSSTLKTLSSADVLQYKKEINEAKLAIKQQNREIDNSREKIQLFANNHSIVAATLQRYNTGLLRAIGGVADLVTSFRNQRKVQTELTKIAKSKLDIEQQTKRMQEAEKARAQKKLTSLQEIQQNMGEALAKKELAKQARGDFDDKSGTELKRLRERVKKQEKVVASGPFTPRGKFVDIDKEKSELEKLQLQLTKKEAEVEKTLGEYDSTIKEVNSAASRAADAYNLTAKSGEKLKSDLSNLGVRIAETGTEFENISNELELTDSEIEKLGKDLRKAEIDEKFVPWINALELAQQVVTDFVFSVRDTQKAFGIAAGNAIELQFDNLVASFKSFTSSLTSLGKKVSVTTEEILSAQKVYQTEFGGVIISEAASSLAQQAKELGVSIEDLIAARRVFMTSAMGDVVLARSLQNQFIEKFKEQGFTQGEALQLSVKYSDIIARNGNRFADSFVRAAGEAKKIGVDLGKIDQIGDNIINNFEGFLESQAELGAMGFGFDTSRLAELAEFGDTGALARELQVQLASTGKNLQTLSRSQRLAIENAFGLSIAEMQRMASGAGGGEELTDQQKTNNRWTRFTNLLEGVIAPALTISASVSKFMHTQLLTGILINTGRTAGAAGGLTSALHVLKSVTLPGYLSMVGGGAGLLGGAVGIGGGTALGMATGGSAKASAIGSLIGTVAGGVLGSVIPVIGIPLGAAAGGFIGGGIAGMMDGMYGDDFISTPGYGSRVLLTPNKAIALNNEDNFVAYANDLVSTEAGLQFFNKGALVNDTPTTQTMQKLDTSGLENKMDKFLQSLDTNLRTALSSTHVYMDGVAVGRRLANANSAIDAVGVFGVQGYRGNPTY
jgi:hypothetical protein